MPEHNQQRFAVVGGGLLGMTVALRLAQRGHRVTLLEASDHLGGLADAWQIGDVTWDRHYHVTLLSDMYLRRLLDEIGMGRDIEWSETKTGFYTDGVLHSMSNTWEFLRFPPLRLIDKLRLGFTIFYASKIKDWRRLERIPVGDWLRRLSGRRTFERIWLPLLRSKLGNNYRRTSAAFIWATIARMYAARHSGLKKEMFGYVRGGYARTLEAFGRHLAQQGVDIRLRHAVQRISASSEGGFDIQVDGDTEQFDRGVVTVPAPLAARMCPGLTDREKDRLERVEYQGIVCASLLLKKPLAEYYVTNITDGGVPFTGVIEMSALVDRDTFGGRALVYLPKYVSSDDPAFDLSDEAIRGQFVAALDRMYAAFDPSDVEAFRVSRVRHVCALSTIDYSRHVPQIETSQPGLYVVTSAQIVNGTLNVNETVRLAEQSIDRLVQPLPASAIPDHATKNSDVEADRQLVAGP